MTKRKKKTSKKTESETTVETPTPESESEFSFETVETAHESIQEDSPAPNEAAIAAQSEAKVEQVAAAQGNTDSAGTVFNPELHATSADGEPSITPSGKFRKKRGASKVSTTNAAIAEQQKTAEQRAAARATGQLAADLMIGSAVTMLGEEWIPIGQDGKQEMATFNEHENLRRAFGDYFEAKGIHDFPPGIALSIAMSSYMMPRLVAGPETKTKLGKAKIWLAEKWNNVKRKQKNAAQSDSRDNGKRKDDASEKAVRDKQPAATRHART